LHLAACAQGDDTRPKTSESFARDVAPLVAKHCGDCHSADFSERKLDLSSVEGVLRGSETGAVIAPGSAATSLLVQVLANDADPHMPPKGQLAEDEIAAIAKWIDALQPDTLVGAPRITAADREHWSFRPIVRPLLPPVNDASWAITPIDRFILADLQRHDLSPSPPADKATLLRRVYFDLIGLPPTPEEVEAFLNDPSPDAYEAVVDRLLASPRYGERWGRHWLDLARYADSGGFHNDIDRPNAWRYRDYVIDSFNGDKPYGEFLRQQIAGDALPEAALEDWIATGFCRHGPSNDDNMGKTPTDRERYRMDELDDVVSTTANVFLGLTIGCARCHDHKFDPISQRDYYRFTAYFASAERKELTLAEFDPAAPQLKPVAPKPDLKTPAAMVFSDYGRPPQPMHLLWRGDVTKKGPEVTPGVPAVLTSSSADSLNGSPIETSNASSRLELAEWIASRDNPLTWRVMANRLWHYHFGRGLAARRAADASRTARLAGR
jgi:mono/diheme cytochrome c family protein